jgi:HD-like signal output (HDOD) protein/ActR/RegA family two-component response regulator
LVWDGAGLPPQQGSSRRRAELPVRVLFVDDEPRVLEAIERLFFDLEVDGETSFASSVETALAEFAPGPVDVIVCDMRMPGQDSATLLNRVCEIEPRTIRIVLSGQTDEASALRVVPVAHQFLAKPCEANTLRRVIEHTSALRQLLDDAKLQSLVGQVGQLPSPPRLFTELSRLLEDDAADASHVAELVQQDPAMASKLLQVANSALFASSNPVSDVKTAVVRLGTRTLRNLALGVGAFEAARGSAKHLASFIDNLQNKSLSIARLARALTQKPVDADATFMAGLVCDLGQLVLATVAPERLREAQAEAARLNAPCHVAERSLWGVTHAEVGAFVLGLWGLPFPIVEAVANSHSPERNAHERCGLPQIVWLAACVIERETPDPTWIERYQMQDVFARSRRILSGQAA